MENLHTYIEGFYRFKDNYYQKRTEVREVFGSQSPKTLVVSCSDSRVDPALLFDCDPGDFFVIRNVANLIPPYVKDSSFHGVSAALEYAVRTLEVEDIIVLGHSNCGGVKHLLSTAHDDSEFLKPWLNIASPALMRINVMDHESEAAKLCSCEKETILVSMGNLTSFPWIKERVDSGGIQLHGWYFNMLRGTLERWSPKDRDFVPFIK